jgi:hypothetical protein
VYLLNFACVVLVAATFRLVLTVCTFFDGAKALLHAAMFVIARFVGLPNITDKCCFHDVVHVVIACDILWVDGPCMACTRVRPVADLPGFTALSPAFMPIVGAGAEPFSSAGPDTCRLVFVAHWLVLMDHHQRSSGLQLGCLCEHKYGAQGFS